MIGLILKLFMSKFGLVFSSGEFFLVDINICFLTYKKSKNACIEFKKLNNL